VADRRVMLAELDARDAGRDFYARTRGRDPETHTPFGAHAPGHARCISLRRGVDRSGNARSRIDGSLGATGVVIRAGSRNSWCPRDPSEFAIRETASADDRASAAEWRGPMFGAQLRSSRFGSDLSSRHMTLHAGHTSRSRTGVPFRPTDAPNTLAPSLLSGFGGNRFAWQQLRCYR
jgi:hypothetical protein